MQGERSREEGPKLKAQGELEVSSGEWASDTSPPARPLNLRQRVTSALGGSPFSRLRARIKSTSRAAFRRLRQTLQSGSYQALEEEGISLGSPQDTQTRVRRWLNDLPDSVCSVPPELYRSTRRSFSI